MKNARNVSISRKIVLQATVFLFLLCLGIGNRNASIVNANEATTFDGVDYESVFDADYYAKQNPDVVAVLGNDPDILFQHFVLAGMKEGRSGNQEFNLASYIENNVDLVEKYGEVDYRLYFWHYITIGKNEGRSGNEKTKPEVSKSVYDILVSFKEIFPEGMYWTNNEYYDWKGGIYYRGYGCAGFAFLLSDAAFGTVKSVKHVDYNNIKVGDILRVNNDTHMVIVLEVYDDYVVVAEGNYNKTIHWGRVISIEELRQGIGDYIMTRYPI